MLILHLLNIYSNVESKFERIHPWRLKTKKFRSFIKTNQNNNNENKEINTTDNNTLNNDLQHINPDNNNQTAHDASYDNFLKLLDTSEIKAKVHSNNSTELKPINEINEEIFEAMNHELPKNQTNTSSNDDTILNILKNADNEINNEQSTNKSNSTSNSQILTKLQDKTSDANDFIQNLADDFMPQYNELLTTYFSNVESFITIHYQEIITVANKLSNTNDINKLKNFFKTENPNIYKDVMVLLINSKDKIDNIISNAKESAINLMETDGMNGLDLFNTNILNIFSLFSSSIELFDSTLEIGIYHQIDIIFSNIRGKLSAKLNGLDEHSAKQVKDIISECKFFMNELLDKNSSWYLELIVKMKRIDKEMNEKTVSWIIGNLCNVIRDTSYN